MMEIIDHRVEGVRQVESPHQNDRPDAEISLIVLHGISLPAGSFGSEEVEALFCNRLDTSRRGFRSLAGVEVSSHLFVRRDGSIVQFVPFDRRAWHAGESRIGSRENCNDFSIGIELEGTDIRPYETVQYEVLAELCLSLMRHYGISEIVGHSHIAPGRKTDPGPSFRWQRLRGLLAARL